MLMSMVVEHTKKKATSEECGDAKNELFSVIERFQVNLTVAIHSLII